MTTAVQIPEITEFPSGPEQEILTPEATRFLRALDRCFEEQRVELLNQRRDRQELFDRGELPVFLPRTKRIRESRWSVAPIPAELLDRRVEITGPPDRKMIINALNSGANVFMADFEDATSPTWANIVEGQANLMDAVRRTITYENEAGKRYSLKAPL